MRNSTIKAIVGPCIDCNRNTFLTAGRCKIDYQKHRSKVCADRNADKPAKEKPVKVKSTKRVASLFDKPLPALLLIAQKEFNTFIRLRDQKNDCFVCISCLGVKPLDQLNAGHYYSMGGHSALRFDEHNCHSQCIKCNCHLHGNLTLYRENLLIKIGKDQLERLDTWRNKSVKWDKLQVIGIIQLYRDKIKKEFL